MSTRSIIGIDSEKGFYKHFDGSPRNTISSLLTYIGIFGYDLFIEEWNRINKSGGCSNFFYVHDFKDLKTMIKTKKLTDTNYNEKESFHEINSEEFGYIVLENKIIVYDHDKKPYIIKYNKKELKKTILIGIFEKDLLERFTILYRLK